jgi:osmotically-inducible protein OsmY
LKNSIRSIVTLSLLTLGPTAVYANNTWEDRSKDAWLDGKAESTLLFNGNLNSFDINTDVQSGVVILTGKVDSKVDKALAEELVESLEGVISVENKLTVMTNDKGDESEILGSLTDSKVEVVVKTKLLLESEVTGTDIEVEVENGVVTLRGEVDSDSAKQLAAAIANNTKDVKSVVNKLAVSLS